MRALLYIVMFLLFSPTAFAHEEDVKAEKEVMKITEKGMIPSSLSLKTLDASVFFVNATSDALITLETDFGKRRVHCASSNMKYESSGRMRSTKPIGPKDFAIMCFPERGEYVVTAYGVRSDRKPVVGKVIIE